jgi:hypothetical protein
MLLTRQLEKRNIEKKGRVVIMMNSIRRCSLPQEKGKGKKDGTKKAKNKPPNPAQPNLTQPSLTL